MEFDEYQVDIQQTDVAQDDEYINSSSEMGKTYSSFKCAYEDCNDNYFDEECVECREIGYENKCFCLLHQSHHVHHTKNVDEDDKKSNLNDDIIDENKNLEDNVGLIVGNANQLYIYNLLKCITQVSHLFVRRKTKCNIFFPLPF